MDAHLYFHHRGTPCTAAPLDTEARQEAPSQQHVGKSLGGDSKCHTEQKHHLQEKLGFHGAQTPQNSIILLVRSTSAVLQHPTLCDCFAAWHGLMRHKCAGRWCRNKQSTYAFGMSCTADTYSANKGIIVKCIPHQSRSDFKNKIHCQCCILHQRIHPPSLNFLRVMIYSQMAFLVQLLRKLWKTQNFQELKQLQKKRLDRE